LPSIAFLLKHFSRDRIPSKTCLVKNNNGGWSGWKVVISQQDCSIIACGISMLDELLHNDGGVLRDDKERYCH
jgi:hypothetical protein